jgi:hypothetical protein
MSKPDDEPFGDDPELEKFADDFERHHQVIYDYLSDFMDEHEVDQLYVAEILMDIVLGLRMTAYGVTVENPSVAGLKLELDRLGRDLDDMVREAKKGAEGFIRETKALRAEAEAAGEIEGEDAAG